MEPFGMAPRFLNFSSAPCACGKSRAGCPFDLPSGIVSRKQEPFPRTEYAEKVKKFHFISTSPWD